MPKEKSRPLPFVSGWDDDTQGIEDDPNPREVPEKEVLWAAENGEFEVLKTVILQHPSCLHVRDKDGYTPLHRACYNDHVAVVDFLLQQGADIHARTSDLWQPLHSACMWDNAGCAAKLLEHGANVNSCSEGGQTPLHVAASNSKSTNTLVLLLTHRLLKPELRNRSDETGAEIARRSNPHYWIFESVESCFILPL